MAISLDDFYSQANLPHATPKRLAALRDITTAEQEQYCYDFMDLLKAKFNLNYTRSKNDDFSHNFSKFEQAITQLGNNDALAQALKHH